MRDLVETTGERLSFYSLLKERDCSIVIPRIQRDYAQGRENTKLIRTTFLEALKDYLDLGTPFRDLDFVYGRITNRTLTPLDGQQRLTTLFLLHWYLAVCAEKQEHFKDFLLVSGKSRFSYETRTSSHEFCSNLVKEISNFKISELVEGSLSKTIIDQGWYHFSWANDPTVDGMLRMLDSIHILFNESSEYYDKLVDPDKPIITFLFLNLDNFGLTDDLYIKMNSRGKPLTDFENFKAKFEQEISQLKWEPQNIKLEIQGRSVDPSEYFNHKIDTIWADFFWSYRTKNEDDSYDKLIMNFFKNILINYFIINDNQDLTSPIEDFINKKDPVYYDIKQLEIISTDFVNYLIKIFDVFITEDSQLRIILGENNYYHEVNYFHEILGNRPSYPIRLMFFAYSEFITYHKEYNQSQLYDWMRVVRNLVANTIYNNFKLFSASIIELKRLIPFSLNILEFLKNEDNDIKSFAQHQIKEERVKAHLITSSKNWNSFIESAEKNKYFSGQIMFLLSFSGVLKHYELTREYPIDEKPFLLLAQKYLAKSNAIFEADNSTYNPIENYAFERAVLTKGFYPIEAKNNRFSFLIGKKENNQRDFSWKKLLQYEFTDEAGSLIPKQEFVKSVFDDDRFDLNNPKHSLEQIAQDKSNSWLDMIIQHPDILNYSNQGFFYKDDIATLIYGSSQRNHYHIELFSYHFYLDYLSNSAEFKPFVKCWYYEVKSIEEQPCAVIDEFIHKESKFAINIYYESSINSYRILFFNRNGHSDTYSEITTFLNEFSSVDKDGYHAFETSTTSSKETEEILTQLCQNLVTITES